jgi:putative SOS response-associated peptidase YedK
MTGPSTGHLASYHTRAAVILEPGEWGAWLATAADVEALMRSVRSKRFEVGEAP